VEDLAWLISGGTLYPLPARSGIVTQRNCSLLNVP